MVREKLYQLLPAIYRRKDFFNDEPLRALLAIVEQELGILEADINNLYENWFIETSDEWVLPYLAELVGIQDLNDPEKILPIQRSRIGNAIRYRRHKGTPRTLELAIEDTTGWTVRLVEMFNYVLTTQYIQRVRPQSAATFALTQSTAMVAMQDFFDSNAHTLDIRAVDVNDIRYNLRSLSLFIWRLQSYPIKRSTPWYRSELPIKAVDIRRWDNSSDTSKYEFEQAVFGFNTSPSQRKHTVQVSPRTISNRNSYYRHKLKKKSQPDWPVINQTGCYTFHPLGYDMPLFNQPKSRENQDLWAHELHSIELPIPISHKAFEEDLRPFQMPPDEKTTDEKFIKIFRLGDGDDYTYPNDWVEQQTENTTYSLLKREKDYRKSVDLKEVPAPQVEPSEPVLNSEYYYGPGRSLVIYISGKNQGGEYPAIPPEKIVAKRLTNWEEPPPGKIAVDVELGRLMFASGEDPGWDNLEVNFSYGFSGNMGGGPYNRSQTLVQDAETIRWVARKKPPEATENWYTSLSEAIAAWKASGESHNTIRIMDNQAHFTARTLTGPVVDDTLLIELGPCDRLTIEAGNGYRPTISPLGGDLVVSGGKGSTLRLNGLLCGGRIIIAGEVQLEVDHCTIRPKRSPDQTQETVVGITEISANAEVAITNSIVGQVNLPIESGALVVGDSIIDGAGKAAIMSTTRECGPVTKIERTTIFGGVYIEAMQLGSEAIFMDPVKVQNKGSGGLRYSYVPVGYQISAEPTENYYYSTPERYECQPKSLDNPELQPSLTSQQYGQPAYAQLSLSCPQEIQKGAENNTEMGAFNNLQRPQQEANLAASLDEYLRFGMEVSTVYKN
ncbi:phage tail protein [Moorena producens]|uniref:phage tail protein n=1 Tax=Moorena producens TaxID=1155739 RepID=UPI003C75EE43